MMIVGVTGGIGSGKTTVVNFFSEFKNVAIYVADLEAKKLINSSETIKENLIKEFGELTFINHQLDRKYIAEIVFKNKEKLEKLNAIVHPEVKKHFQEFVKNNNKKDYIIYENAILFETKSNLICDLIVTVFADINIKIKRVIARDSASEKEVLDRMKNQWQDDKKIVQSNYVISNNALAETELQVYKIHNILTRKSQNV
jgi:dephospho-CoA kinase